MVCNIELHLVVSISTQRERCQRGGIPYFSDLRAVFLACIRVDSDEK